MQDIWNQVQAYFTDRLHFSIEFHFWLSFLLFKITYYFYSNYRFTIPEKYGFLSFNNFLNEISKIRILERRLAVNNRSKCARLR